MKVTVLLENGMSFTARGFGAGGTKVGEIVFNTSMTGYQEIITDPSYAGQFVVFTMPEIGNVGVNKDDNESKKAYLKGIIVREYVDNWSNFRGEKSLNEFLKEQNILGISEIDTRFLTKLIRKEGAMMMIASSKIHNIQKLKEILNQTPRIEEVDYIKEVSTKEAYIHPNGAWNGKEFKYNPKKTDKKIAVLDFGVKRNILNELTQAGMECKVMPASTKAEEIIEMYKNGEIQGVFLSNGPGDPLILNEIHKEIQKILKEKIPMFGICLGHQLLSISHGYPTYKLKFGHHGGNHPVKNYINRKPVVEITAQNHNYNVPEEIEKIAEVTHKNLFDGSIEGVKYKNEPVFSVQHHPEASPGPHDSKYIFKEFYNML
ncbi:glutamine-hydrolyzing carbamoyl-phosphate synthase small subunit [Lebetimonas sp. JS032]|uniref:glutamine-hydrolyzing carbamoyl-phosphate synthase small subunit n=1 Tax=Lebetimonas sp. JS032 TaxID=990070 RepID=UPI0004644F40|nr:glutamine-hydrolyzing carbamoyl-phosphate synthase small subunit [Lebetimonas sp. JS032]